jgi:hypothetical protein
MSGRLTLRDKPSLNNPKVGMTLSQPPFSTTETIQQKQYTFKNDDKMLQQHTHYIRV